MASGDVASIAVADRAPRPLFRFDVSLAVLDSFAAVLCILVILPMTWLVIYGFSTPRTGEFTLANFHRLFTDPAFLDPLLVTGIVAVSSSVICCLVAAPMGWLVARTDVPFSRTVRALVTASWSARTWP